MSFGEIIRSRYREVKTPEEGSSANLLAAQYILFMLPLLVLMVLG